jgi:hypothetical protein
MRPTVLNAAETWTLNGMYENLLEIWEYREGYMEVKVDGQWRRRTNDEVATLFGEHKITQEMIKMIGACGETPRK